MGNTPKNCPPVPCAIALLQVAGAGEPEISKVIDAEGDAPEDMVHVGEDEKDDVEVLEAVGEKEGVLVGVGVKVAVLEGVGVNEGVFDEVIVGVEVKVGVGGALTVVVGVGVTPEESWGGKGVECVCGVWDIK